MIRGKSKLTDEIRSQLTQGTKVEFKWHGSDRLYTGRIEVGPEPNKTLFFINEHCFDNGELTEINEGMRYYNTLDSFFHFNHFVILK